MGAVRVVEPAVDAAVEDAASPMPSVAFEAPADGATFVQDTVMAGDWAANVTFRVRERDVARVEIWADDEYLLGQTDGGALTYPFHGEGARRIAAVGFDEGGAEVARDEIGITIEPPADTSCHAMLDGLGLDWSEASATRGIADPVRVQPVINGVAFRYVSRDEPTAMLMDCELALRLHALSQILVPYGIDEVIHIGIYNYRCIGGGDPDSGTCTPSQHAYARAIDLHAFGLEGSDETYSTETDWVITSRGDDCPIESFGSKDEALKALACAMWSERIFQIVLTPNYNAAHRNHFHVDLTEGSMYIGQSAAGVDPPVDGLGH
ncbi:MAG TPA: extensin family protein [Sandaracinaceae bacterium LLY-WYZ-13_1]|nr:extensin family protein [Sandaracinaceae bacterium LLY-WYZ-13_1]